ncbi:hypothetical protein MOUN0_J03180 [Monosporozyma unispora]
MRVVAGVFEEEREVLKKQGRKMIKIEVFVVNLNRDVSLGKIGLTLHMFLNPL